jgi:Zn-finger nucleic acid-binding protein
MSERSGVEIDYCPKCRGVWLDRGELDKLIERSVAGAAVGPVAPGAQQPVYTERPRKYDSDDLHPDEYQQKYGQPRKKKSWLGEMFDF